MTELIPTPHGGASGALKPQKFSLTLPYPISSNRYWRTMVMAGSARTYVSKEAKDYKEQVMWLCRAAGIRAPLTGRVELVVHLYPNRPQDWKTRLRKFGEAWDDGVRCIDLDNANKVLLDSLKGVAIEDDGWQVRDLHSTRMEPDEKPGRLEVVITALTVQAVVAPAPGRLFA